MIRDAATCDRRACLGLLLEPDDYPGEFDGAFLTEQGWTRDPGGGHVCPACSTDRGPILERGECERCGGRVGERHGRELCLSCGQLTPHNGPEWRQEGWDDDGLEEAEEAPTSPGEWAGDQQAPEGTNR